MYLKACGGSICIRAELEFEALDLAQEDFCKFNFEYTEKEGLADLLLYGPTESIYPTVFSMAIKGDFEDIFIGKKNNGYIWNGWEYESDDVDSMAEEIIEELSNQEIINLLDNFNMPVYDAYTGFMHLPWDDLPIIFNGLSITQIDSKKNEIVEAYMESCHKFEEYKNQDFYHFWIESDSDEVELDDSYGIGGFSGDADSAVLEYIDSIESDLSGNFKKDITEIKEMITQGLGLWLH